MSKIINMGLTPDTQDNNGNWKRGICINYQSWETVSGRRWLELNKRCKNSETKKIKYPSYINCTNGFKNFNQFVEWSRSQIGYDVEGYQLDKDLLIKGNKIYSPETCLFLPQRINSLLIKCDTKRGRLPIGVGWSKTANKFIARCNDQNSQPIHLGTHNSIESAFKVYKEFKESVIKNIAEKYKDKIDIRAYNALIRYEVDVND